MTLSSSHQEWWIKIHCIRFFLISLKWRFCHHLLTLKLKPVYVLFCSRRKKIFKRMWNPSSTFFVFSRTPNFTGLGLLYNVVIMWSCFYCLNVERYLNLSLYSYSLINVKYKWITCCCLHLSARLFVRYVVTLFYLA